MQPDYGELGTMAKRKIGFDIANTEEEIYPNATLGPDTHYEKTQPGYITKDSTNAPEIGENSEISEPYAQTQAALFDKYVFSPKIIPFAIVMVFIGWIFVQDNGAGKLTNWKDVFWTIQKCGVVIGIYIIITPIQWLINKLAK